MNGETERKATQNNRSLGRCEFNGYSVIDCRVVLGFFNVKYDKSFF
jgi:hypothetical protein